VSDEFLEAVGSTRVGYLGANRQQTLSLGLNTTFEAKLRQYRVGKAFCDRVADEAGPDGVRLVWRSPEDLPDLAELEAPERWLDRVPAR